MHILLLALAGVILAGGNSALATAQMPDTLIYEGKKHPLFSNPLESYYDKSTSPRPNFQPWHTANYRGYVAVWEIDNQELYLKDIRAKVDNQTVGLDYLFPGHSGRVEAKWFSGSLRVPIGAVQRYIHQGYASVYEEELFITIKGGKVVNKELIDNRSKVRREK